MMPSNKGKRTGYQLERLLNNTLQDSYLPLSKSTQIDRLFNYSHFAFDHNFLFNQYVVSHIRMQYLILTCLDKGTMYESQKV